MADSGRLAQLEVAGDGGSGRFRLKRSAFKAPSPVFEHHHGIVFHPIVSLASGQIFGYEATCATTDSAVRRPKERFSSELEICNTLEILARVLRILPHLPEGRFISLDVPGSLLGDARFHGLLGDQAEGLVLEVSEHSVVADVDLARQALASLRSRGARVALDHAGAGFDGLSLLTSLRPEIVKLDASLVRGVALDLTKAMFASTMGSFVAQMSSWLLADGVDCPGDLEALLNLGIPLAQGRAIATPSAFFDELDLDVSQRIEELSAKRSMSLQALDMVETLPTQFATAKLDSDCVVVDEWLRPKELSLATGEGSPRVVPVTIQAEPAEDVSRLLRRAMLRAPKHRFDPVVVVEGAGAYIGVARIEDLITAVAQRSLRGTVPKPSVSSMALPWESVS